MFWWLFLNNWNFRISDCSAALKGFCQTSPQVLLPNSNYINCYINRCLLHQNLLHLGTQIFLSLYASGWKKKSFDVAKEHFMLSGCGQKGSHQSDSFAFMRQRTEKKDPEGRAHHQPWLSPLTDLFILAKLIPFPNIHTSICISYITVIKTIVYKKIFLCRVLADLQNTVMKELKEKL